MNSILNTLLEASAHFLHTPLMVFVGLISYLAYKGYQSSCQKDRITYLERKVREMRAELIKNNDYVDGVALERAELKDELKEVTRHKDNYRNMVKECHKREREYEREIISLRTQLEDMTNQHQQAQDRIKELEDDKPVIGETELQSLIEDALIDYISRSDIGWTLATEISDKLDIELDLGC